MTGTDSPPGSEYNPGSTVTVSLSGDDTAVGFPVLVITSPR